MQGAVFKGVAWTEDLAPAKESIVDTFQTGFATTRLFLLALSSV